MDPQNINFWTPQDASQYQTWQQRAQALQQQSMTPFQGQGVMAPTQGVAQLAQALVAHQLKQRAANLAWNAQRPDAANALPPAVAPLLPQPSMFTLGGVNQ